MPIEGFDYKAFAINLAKDAAEILSQQGSNAAPDTLTETDKKNIIETVRRFCLMCGEALSNDPQLKFTAEQACLVTQFIGEWTFHKSIDLITGKIPNQFREPILQVIAANIFNTGKLAIIKGMPQNTLVDLIEEKVKQVYSDELKKLLKKGVISQKEFEIAVNSSNLDDLVQKSDDENNLSNLQEDKADTTPKDKKVLKLAALAILLKNLPEERANQILNSLDKNDVVHVTNYMKMNNIEDKIDHNVIIKSLEEIKNIIPASDVINVHRLLQKHYKLINSLPPDVLSEIALNEREAVKDFILDNTFPAQEMFTPCVIQSLVNSIEEQVHDY